MALFFRTLVSWTQALPITYCLTYWTLGYWLVLQKLCQAPRLLHQWAMWWPPVCTILHTVVLGTLTPLCTIGHERTTTLLLNIHLVIHSDGANNIIKVSMNDYGYPWVSNLGQDSDFTKLLWNIGYDYIKEQDCTTQTNSPVHRMALFILKLVPDWNCTNNVCSCMGASVL